MAEIGVGFAIGFMKSEQIYDSNEFQALPSDEQRYLLAPTVPSFEVISVSQRSGRAISLLLTTPPGVCGHKRLHQSGQ
jgi:hypothetical protein